METDIVQLPLLHDTPATLAQAHVKDWKEGRMRPDPGKPATEYIAVERDYFDLYKNFTLGRLAAGEGIAAAAKRSIGIPKSRSGTARAERRGA